MENIVVTMWLFVHLDADNDDDSDFDAFADSDDENEKPSKKKKLKKASSSKSSSSDKPLSKKERMEALAKRRASAKEGPDTSSSSPRNKREKQSKKTSSSADGEAAGEQEKAKGYESGDSYNSATFERTKEDIDFIDNEGEDEDLLREYNAEQHFDDERPDGTDSEDEDESGRKRKNKKGSTTVRKRSNDVLSDVEDGDEEPSNPISAAVWRMKKNKKVKKNDVQLIEEAKEFLVRMDGAADDDDKAIQEKKPAFKKLSMLSEVVQTLTKIELMIHLLDEDLLIVCKRWIQPLPNGTLGNITVRQRLLDAIGNMNGVSTDHLKRSGFGKVVMQLHMHPSETPAMKRLLKSLIEKWSRPIFKREGNLRYKPQEDLRRDSGITGYARAQQAYANSGGGGVRKGRTTDDLTSIIASGHQAKSNSLGNNRVQVPYTKGFQFSVRPKDKLDPSMARKGNSARSNLNKTMIQKKRSTSGKIQRSVDMSADGKGLHR